MGPNEAQERAIKHGDGPCMVLAGPGSGKTLYDCQTNTVFNRALQSKTRRNSGHYFYQGSFQRDERAVSGLYQREELSGYVWNLSRSVFWYSEMGIPSDIR